MYCDRCGTHLVETTRFCGSCGKPVMGGPPRTTVGRVGRVGGHLRLLGYFWIAYSALRMTAGWFLHEFFGRFFAYNFWSPHLPFLFPGLLRGIGMILLATFPLKIQHASSLF